MSNFTVDVFGISVPEEWVAYALGAFIGFVIFFWLPKITGYDERMKIKREREQRKKERMMNEE